MACESLRAYTAASSDDSRPTSSCDGKKADARDAGDGAAAAADAAESASAAAAPPAPPGWRRPAAASSARSCAGAILQPQPPPGESEVRGGSAAAAAAGAAAAGWAALTSQQLDRAIADEYEAFARTGWVIAGDYAPLAPRLRADLRAFFRPYNAALKEALGGCNVLEEDGGGGDDVPIA